MDFIGVQGSDEINCHIEVRLVPFGTVAVKETGKDSLGTINGAAGRVERLVAHRLERARESKTGRSEYE